MAVSGLTLPALTEPDPEIAGEGSLDPLGLAQIADRLAEHLVPGVRARMRRVRFVTASALGAAACDALFDLPPFDGVSSPSICFEWLVLEAFARRNSQDSALDSSGVPGSSKVRAVLAQTRRLTARNYLKSPNVFGFTGVYLPLARSLELLDEDRRPAANITDLTMAWELDQDLHGFTDRVPSTPGGQLRNRIRDEVSHALLQGHCATEAGSPLWGRLSKHLHPLQPGPREKTVLRTGLTSAREPMRGELAPAVGALPDLAEPELIAKLAAGKPSAELKRRLEAALAYERVSWILDAAFRQLRYTSTVLGMKPLTPTMLAGDPVLAALVVDLPGAVRQSAEKLERLDVGLLAMHLERLGRFEQPMSVPDFVEVLLAHHQTNQARKLPNGKRPWFEELGAGWVVRSLYREPQPVDPDVPKFIHPYRLVALQQFMRDLQP